MKWTEKEIIDRINLFIEKFEKFPTSSSLPKTNFVLYPEFKGLDAAIRLKSYGYYQNKMNYESAQETWNSEKIKERFDSIIKQTGYIPNYQTIKKFDTKLFSAIQTHYKSYQNFLNLHNLSIKDTLRCLNGEIVKSEFELIVANFFYLNNIDFVYEDKIIDDSNYLFDFKIKNKQNDDVYVEIWGFENRKNNSKLTEIYNLKREKKSVIYQKNNFNLISLERNDFEKDPEQLWLFLIDKFKNIFTSQNNKDLYLKLYSGSLYATDDLIKDINDFKKKENVEIINQTTLLKHKQHRLIHYMKKFGWNDILEKLGQKREERNQKYKRGYLKDWNNYKKELCQYVNEDILMSSLELKKINRAVVEAANNFGGFLAVREKLTKEGIIK